MDITWVGSPNYSPGRGGKKVDRIVMHWFGEGRLADTDREFLKDGSKPPYPGRSAHFAIEDKTVHQYVQLDSTGWHASNFDVNQRSVGIEHSAQPRRDASESTYDTSAQLIVDICHKLGLVPSRGLLHKHSEYRPTQCPGTLDLDRIAARTVEIWNASQGDVSVLNGPVIPASTVSVPVHFTVTIKAPLGSANIRSHAAKDASVVRTEPNGKTLDCVATVQSDSMTVTWPGGTKVMSDRWYVLADGRAISAAVSIHQ